MSNDDARLAELPKAGLPLRCLVTGRVQGVAFRASTFRRAEELGLSGFVRNLDDGRVEAVFSGESDRVREMIAWLWEGPALARVRAVAVESWTEELPEGFEIC